MKENEKDHIGSSQLLCEFTRVAEYWLSRRCRQGRASGTSARVARKWYELFLAGSRERLVCGASGSAAKRSARGVRVGPRGGRDAETRARLVVGARVVVGHELIVAGPGALRLRDLLLALEIVKLLEVEARLLVGVHSLHGQPA